MWVASGSAIRFGRKRYAWPCNAPVMDVCETPLIDRDVDLVAVDDLVIVELGHDDESQAIGR